jgi:hypothetical protein
MYSVFETGLQTTKSRHNVQTYDNVANAQLVYAGLLQAYEEDLSTSLLATDIRSELTLLRFDDKWKKSSELFLLYWKSKILELEQLEDKAIDDSTKRLWLTATLATKNHMSTCLTQAKVTEMTLLGMSPTGSQQMPWESFYNLILAHAKLHDHSTASTTKTKRDANIHERGGGGRRDGGGRGQPYAERGSGASTRLHRTNYVFTTVTGPHMIMKSNTRFKPEEWNKLSAEQKTKLCEAKNLPPQLPKPPPTL